MSHLRRLWHRQIRVAGPDAHVVLGEHWRANRRPATPAAGSVGCSATPTSRAEGDAISAPAASRSRRSNSRAHPTVRKEPHARPGASVSNIQSRRRAQALLCIPARLDYPEIALTATSSDDASHLAAPRIRQREPVQPPAGLPRGNGRAAPLNFDVAAFQRTFPKAIAFELEDNVERFIREFILEESPLDVREVRAALRAYDDTRKRLGKQEDEAAFLRRITEQHTLFETSRREEALLQHTHHRLKLLQAEERRDDHTAKLQRLEAEHADDLNSLEQAGREAAEVGQLLGEVRLEIQKDPAQVEFDKLDRQKRELDEKVNALRDARTSAHQQLDDRHYRWTQWLKHGAALALDGLKEVLFVDDAWLARLRSGTDAERLETLPKLAARFHELWNSVRDLVRPLEDGIKTAKHRLQQLAEDLENLSKGQAPGSFPLFQALRQKLGSRVEQLGRLIEVKPRRNAGGRRSNSFSPPPVGDCPERLR